MPPRKKSQTLKKKVSKSKPTSKPMSKSKPKHLPGQVVVTKSGKRYIVDQNLRYVPLTSKKNAQRMEAEASRSSNSKTGRAKSVAAPRAGSLQLVNGQTYVVGEDRKTYIPITQSAATGTGVLTTLLEIAAVVLIADLVVDLIVDDIALDEIQSRSVQSFGSNLNVAGNSGGDFDNAGGDFGDF